MSDTVKEQIVKHVVVLLLTLPWVKSVQRMNQDGIVWADAPFVTVAQGDDLVEAIQTRPYTTRRAEIMVTTIIRQTDVGDVRSAEEILNQYGADVEAALMADLSLGGLAQEIKSPDWLEREVESKEPHVAVAMRFAIVYRHLRHDPYLAG
jgi:thioredoxin-like negative regulator of GroEL